MTTPECDGDCRAANLHRDLNRRTADALGLLETRRDPETGWSYLPSWHDMPEQVTALRIRLAEVEAELADTRSAMGKGAEEYLSAVHETRQASLHALEVEADRSRLHGALRDVLAHLTEPGHPGRDCLRTGWVPVEQVEAWRRVLDGEP